MAHIRKRASKAVDSQGNSVVRYQVVWYEPVRDQFGAPTGKLRQTSETFDTERKAKRHLRKVEDQLEGARGWTRPAPRPKPPSRWGSMPSSTSTVWPGRSTHRRLTATPRSTALTLGRCSGPLPLPASPRRMSPGSGRSC
jgi:hypothetical protein